MDENNIISIDGWQIDASSYRIARNGNQKKLEPRSMELLLYLIEHPDRVVTRDEIEASVWPGRVVDSAAMNGCENLTSNCSSAATAARPSFR